MAIAAVAIVHQLFPSASPIAQLLPADTAGFVSADSPWWWANCKTEREQPQTRVALQHMEATMGISIEKDMLPWAGQCGVALLDIQRNSPQVLMMLEIRDRTAFLKALPQLLRSMERKSATVWTDSRYNGVSLREATVRYEGTSLKVASAHFAGWLVFSMGDGVMQKSIDASKEDTPSLQDNAAWAQTLAQLPSKHIAFCAMNGKPLGKIVSALNPASSRQLATMGLDSLLMVGAMNATPSGLRMDSISTVGAGSMQTQWKAMKSAHGITGASLPQLPAGTLLSMCFSNPGQIWSNMEQSMLSSASNEQSAQMANIVRQMKPVDDILQHLSGEFALAVCWTPEHGFGLVVLGDTASPSIAQQQATALTAFLMGMHQPVSGNSSAYQLVLPTPISKEFPTQLSWSGKGSWFKFATQPAYLNGNGQTLLQLPQAAHGADAAMVLDLKSLPALARHIDDITGNHTFSKVVDGLELGKLQLLSYGALDADGSSNRSTTEINNWAWQNLFKLGELLPTTPSTNMPGRPRMMVPPTSHSRTQ